MRALAIVLAVAGCHAGATESRSSNAPRELPTLAGEDASALAAYGRALFHALVDAAPGARPRYLAWPRSDRAFGRADRFVRTPVPFTDDAGARHREQLPVVFAVAFDPTAAAHVAALGDRATLTALTALRSPLPEFPTSAVALKLVFYPVHARGLTAVPLDDGRGDADHTWPTAVAIDPMRATIPAGETARVDVGAHGDARVVPLARFAFTTLATDAEVARARAASGDRTLARGDHLALVAMHVTTKQVPDWVWLTYWWDDRAPADARVDAASPYRVDAALAATGAHYNPWLEARFPRGRASNCVACHQRAAFGVADYLPVTFGATPPDDPYFDGTLATDFVWSLALEPR